jgi:hypothetical protein
MTTPLLHELPQELILLIFSFLTWRDLLTLKQVCRLFRLLYKDTSNVCVPARKAHQFTRIHTLTEVDHVPSLLPEIYNDIKRIVIDKSWKAFKLPTKIQSIEFRGPIDPENWMIELDQHNLTIQEIEIEECPRIKVGRFQAYPNLQSLRVYWGIFEFDLNCVPTSLTELILHRSHRLECIQGLQWCSHLTRLTISECQSIGEDGFQALGCCKLLKHLNLEYNHASQNLHCLNTCTKLETIVLRYFSRIQFLTLTDCKELRKILLQETIVFKSNYPDHDYIICE